MTTGTSKTSSAPNLPPLLAEQLALGELPSEQAELVRARLGSRTEVVVAELQRSDAEIMAAVPVASIAREVARRRAGHRPVRRRRAVWFAVPALACVALLLWLPGSTRQTDPGTRDSAPPSLRALENATPQSPAASGVRLKGFSPHIRLYRRTAGEPELLNDGSLAQAGDVIQISYLAAGQPSAVLVSLDGRGQVTVHLPIPGSNTQAVQLREGGEVFLEDAFELDEAPQFERFILVTAAEPFELAPVRAAAQKLAKDSSRARIDQLPLPESFSQFSVTLIKGAP